MAPGAIDLSNIAETDNGKNYWGGYIQGRLENYLQVDLESLAFVTTSLGLFTSIMDLRQLYPQVALLSGNAMYLLPGGTDTSVLSAAFLSQLAADNITLSATNLYGKGLGSSQPYNFAPRIGFAYQVSPKLVVRGGFGLFYNGFENRGYSPNIGEKLSIPVRLSITRPIAVSQRRSVSQLAPANPANPGNIGVFEIGFSCTALSPSLVTPVGLALRGIQFDYKTPYSMGGNFTVQYQLTPSMSVQAALCHYLRASLGGISGIEQR